MPIENQFLCHQTIFEKNQNTTQIVHFAKLNLEADNLC